MKIIDLLNKIASGEINEDIEIEYQNGYNFEYCNIRNFFDRYIVDKENLNQEIKLIKSLEEENKILEKLEDISEIKCVGCKVEINIVGNKTLFDTDTPIVTEHCIYKINQLIKNQKKIIDYLKSKGE